MSDKKKVLSDRDLDFSEAVNYLYNFSGSTKAEIAEYVGVSVRQVDYIMSGQRGAGKKTAFKLSGFFDLTPQQMFEIGKAIRLQKEKYGEEWSPDDEWGKMLSIEVKELSRLLSSHSPHFTNVQKAKPSLSAGNGSFVVEDGLEGTYHFRTDWLHRVCNPNDAILFDIEGDSMEPTILGGDTVLVDKGKTEFEEDRIFAIGVGDIVFVKRLRMDLLSQKVKVISDNKLKYDPDVVDQDELRILGKVVWRGGEV